MISIEAIGIIQKITLWDNSLYEENHTDGQSAQVPAQ